MKVEIGMNDNHILHKCRSRLHFIPLFKSLIKKKERKKG